MPDNPISTPLPADLPVNWQTGQIVAPNGADVGLSAQHGYNYLMQQLNAAQQAVNTLGQAIAALTGEDIPTSGTDETTIAAALSNKLSINSINTDGLDCNNFKDDGRYQCQGQVLNGPPWAPGETYGHFFVDVYHHTDNWVVQVAYAVNYQSAFIRNCADGNWLEWEKFATATPPQEYDLPLAEGWAEQSGNTCRYAKTQEGMCVVTLKAVPNSAIQGGQATIATLPTGFRPSGLVHGVCSRTDFESDGIALWLYTDGSLQINAVGGLPEGVGVMGELVFVAVN